MYLLKLFQLCPLRAISCWLPCPFAKPIFLKMGEWYLKTNIWKSNVSKMADEAAPSFHLPADTSKQAENVRTNFIRTLQNNQQLTATKQMLNQGKM